MFDYKQYKKRYPFLPTEMACVIRNEKRLFSILNSRFSTEEKRENFQ